VTILVWALVLAVALNPAFVLLAKLLGMNSPASSRR
jgi:predicted PurR-regulated permease PerM